METNLILFLVIVWIGLSAIIGSFGTNRKIGFVGTFFASFFLSPLLAMLFVLASDKIGNKKMSAGETAIFIIPIIILIAIIFTNKHRDNVWERQYNAKVIQEEITQLNSINFSNLNTEWFGTKKEWGTSREPNWSHYDTFNYWDLKFENETEFNNFKTNRIQSLKQSLSLYR